MATMPARELCRATTSPMTKAEIMAEVKPSGAKALSGGAKISCE
jgi:hypothetical protein